MNVKEFIGIPTGNICDCNGLTGSMDAAIMPMDLHMEMAGYAMTVKCAPQDNLTLHKAIALAEPGTVIVLDCGGYTGCGIFGELFATSCKARGIAGIVIDGACRDRIDLIEMNFPTFARGVNPNGSRKEVLGTINEPITCGGVLVNPGDIVIGDADGVVVLPKEKAAEVLEKAKAKKQKESELKPLLAQGKTTVELLGFAKKCGMEE